MAVRLTSRRVRNGKFWKSEFDAHAGGIDRNRRGADATSHQFLRARRRGMIPALRFRDAKSQSHRNS